MIRPRFLIRYQNICFDIIFKLPSCISPQYHRFSYSMNDTELFESSVFDLRLTKSNFLMNFHSKCGKLNFAVSSYTRLKCKCHMLRTMIRWIWYSFWSVPSVNRQKVYFIYILDALRLRKDKFFTISTHYKCLWQKKTTICCLFLSVQRCISWFNIIYYSKIKIHRVSQQNTSPCDR